MRLLNARTKELELRHDKPPYAIVSHRWGAESEEVLFTDINDLSRARRKVKGYQKLLASCSRALDDGLAYVWLDTCCIDKHNERELTTAINSMYEWYQESKVCYAYLHDVGGISEFTKSEWFLRGWTLQELIAPRVLKFFAKDWRLLGTREDLMQLITECTGIKSEVLRSGVIPHDVSIAQRMYWAASRATTEEEDRAYSLLGLFDVHLPAIYGIKQKAFQELQFKIVSKFPDKSLFAWEHAAIECGSSSSTTGLLAASPSQYLDAYEIPCQQFYHPFGSKRLSRWECFSLKNGALCVTLPIRQTEDTSVHEALLRCSLDPPRDPPQGQRPLVVYLKEDNRHGRFVRIHVPTSLHPLQDDSMASFTLEKVYIDEVSHSSRDRASRSRSPLPLSQSADLGPVPNLDVGSYEDVSRLKQNATLENEAAPSSIPTTLHANSGVAPTTEALIPSDEFSVRNVVQPSDPPDLEAWTVVPPFRRFLIRHPQGSKTINIIVCGEPGAGAGGVVNLIAGRDIIDSQIEFKCAPMTFTTHDISLDSKNIRIYYVVGPRDHLLDVEGYNAAIQNVTELARCFRDDGGVHLLLCCMLSASPSHSIHRLFYKVLCRESVPVIVFATGSAGLGRSSLQESLIGMHYDAYASISVVRPRTPGKSDNYERSVETVRKLLLEHINGSRRACLPHIGPSMYVVLKEFLSMSAKRALALQFLIESMRGSGSKATRMDIKVGEAVKEIR